MFKKLLVYILCGTILFSNIVYAENSTPGVNETALRSATQDMLKTVPAVKQADILKLAQSYYAMSNPKIEPLTKNEYKRLVTWIPDFTGKKIDKKKAISFSGNVALSVSYTNAKNFYLSMASATFALDPTSVTGAENLASAIASYYDDMLLKGEKDSNMPKYYEDAIKVYNYALLLSVKDAKFTGQALSVLYSLGNMYLDTNKKDNGVKCFKTALVIDKGYWSARKALYNYYISEMKLDEAIKLVFEESEYPVFVKGTSKVSKAKTEEEKKNPVPQGEVSDAVMERYLDGLQNSNTISEADFLDEIDKEAKAKLQSTIRSVQSRMKFTIPDLRLITQYSNLRSISSPDGQSALDAFQVCVEGYNYRAAYMAERVGKATSAQSGYKTDLGGYPTLRDLERAMASDPDFQLNIDSEWAENSDTVFDEYVEELEQNVDQYKQDPSKAADMFNTISKLMPEQAVMAINPFDYSNPVDIYIQKLNIADFQKKYTVYNNYLTSQTRKNSERVQEALKDADERIQKMADRISDKEAEIHRAHEGDEGDEVGEIVKREIHYVIHTGLIPEMNNQESVLWQQVTQMALDNYNKKTKKYVEKMYNDCMKHVILISDKKVQEYLEDKVIELAFRTIYMSLNDVYQAYRFSGGGYFEPSECGCDEEEMQRALEARRKLQEKLANEQINRNIEAKKKFESGELDENSEYYKKIIRPYEVRINTPFLTGIVGPYKSGFTLNVGYDKFGSIDFSHMQQHIRNTTTYEGGIEVKAFSLEMGKVGAEGSASSRFNVTTGPDKPFSVWDVDVTTGVKIEVSAGTATSSVGAAISSLRGTKVYSSAGFSGDSLLDEDLKAAIGNWKPNLTRDLWNGEYAYEYDKKQ